jgi:hypothetical protein
MSNRTPDAPTTITVDPNDHLPAILQKIRDVPGSSVVLEIPDHCPVLLTATEFRTVKDVADQAGIDLTLNTDDRLRIQLASMFGLKNLGDPGAKPTEGWRPPQTMLGSPRAFGTWTTGKEEDGAGEPEPGTRKRRRRNDVVVDAAAMRPTPEREGSDDIGALDYLNDRGKFLSARNIGRIAAAVLVVAVLAWVAAWYYLPAVTVHATLKQEPVSTELYYSVAAPGASLPSDIAFSAPASEQQATVEFEIRVPATGVQREPDKTAAGSVQLRNPGDAAVTVPAGTALSVYAGTTYTTNEDVEVPAASDGKAGEASVDVTAQQPGAGSNLEQGMLTGKLADLNIYYSNREAAIEGGTDREITVVTEEDIAGAESQVQGNLARAAAQGWERQLPEGQAVVGPSVQPGDPDYSIAQNAGDVADEVVLTGSVDVSGLVYDLGEVQTQAREFFQTELQKQVPEGYALDADSVALGEPEVIAEAPDNVQYRVEASGTAVAVFEGGDQLAGDLAGKSRGQAEAAVGGIPQFASWEIDQSPGWWPKGMPQAADRITVDVQRPAAPEPEAVPSPSPSPAEGQ